MKSKLAVGIATVGFAGLFPPIPIPFRKKRQKIGGTVVSIVSAPLCVLLYYLFWLIPSFGQMFYLAAVIGLLAVAQWAVPLAERALGPRLNHKGVFVSNDQNEIGIDETLGMVVSTYPIAVIHPVHWLWWTIIAFILFRIFDVRKPPPANFFNKWDTAMGVMLDDLFAALYAAGIMALALHIFR